MKVGVIGKPYFFYNSGEQVMFDAEETLLNFDIINWNPNTLIEDYFSSAKIKPRRKNDLIVLDQDYTLQIIRDICKIRGKDQQNSGLKRGINQVSSTGVKELWRQRGCSDTWNDQPFTF